MKVLKAEHAGACYGVQRALDLAYRAARAGKPTCTLGPLIHNPQVVADLKAAGVDAVERVADIPGGTMVVRSHGVVPEVIEEARERGLEIVDATCPHVARAQKAAARLAAEGRFVVVVGEAGHPEVEGICAHARAAGGDVAAVVDAADLPAAATCAGARVGVVVQTTQSREVFERVVSALRERGVDLEVKDTVCTATRQRQDAAAALAGRADAFVVIGGRNSSNTTRLHEICSALCERSYHVESADELDPAWFAGCDTVGVTAGASTPESQIATVVARLEAM
ncbi:MAG TPA: 4-hydroxy-3-methylbut-2-enyl diphosphate reductase [Candidatus Aveggerthella excrementigallinarum]|nr:4-hydroxy-3-methylbut-2-enyl diphosphate reductase [Candidatus Aveggerthella excrementigallinarum]